MFSMSKKGAWGALFSALSGVSQPGGRGGEARKAPLYKAFESACAWPADSGCIEGLRPGKPSEKVLDGGLGAIQKSDGFADLGRMEDF